MASNFAVEPAPAGKESDFDKAPSLFPEILATVIICYTSTTIFTIVRLIAKRSVSSWGLEDRTLPS